jgi:hypothetical protein
MYMYKRLYMYKRSSFIACVPVPSAGSGSTVSEPRFTVRLSA